MDLPHRTYRDLLDRISRLGMAEPDKRNTLRTYLPYRSKDSRNKSDLFDYNIVAGKVLCAFLGCELPSHYTVEQFRADCLQRIRARLTNENGVTPLKDMYLTDENELRRIAPEFVLLSAHERGPASSEHLSSIFCSFLTEARSTPNPEPNVTFVEQLFLNTLREHLRPAQDTANDEPYMPFLKTYFVHDLTFLTQHTDYMLQQLENFLELYNFLYCAQLALNIRQFRDGAPRSKPLYFILDTEKASQERALIQEYGYVSLYKASGYLFPVLSLLEEFNGKEEVTRYPLWRFAEAIKQAGAMEQREAYQVLRDFGERYVKKKEFVEHFERAMLEKVRQHDVLSVMGGLVECAIGQFDQGEHEAGKRQVFDEFKNAFVQHVGRHFVQARGRVGRVLVMNQDFLLLLTNLSIASEPQLRLQVLLQRFQDRGVYFDKQSQQALVSFYERIGNVERMSDSGDAVYVRSTI